MNEGEQSHWFSEIWQEPMGMKGMERVGGERTQKKKKSSLAGLLLCSVCSSKEGYCKFMGFLFYFVKV